MKNYSLYELLRLAYRLKNDNFITRKKMYRKKSEGVKINKLSNAQKKEIQDYWYPIVKTKVSTCWHELLYSQTGVFTPRYLPFEIYGRLISKTNIPNRIMNFMDDKNLYRYFLKGFCTPQTCDGVLQWGVLSARTRKCRSDKGGSFFVLRKVRELHHQTI